MMANANVVYGAPARIPAEVLGAWAGLRVTWTGWDGTTWEISDPRSGVFLHMAGVRGLSMPKFKLYGSSSPAVSGRRHRGSWVAERECFWPLIVTDPDSSAGWLARDTAFHDTLDPDRPGVWAVQLPGGSTRSIELRYLDDGDHAYEEDPVLAGLAVYGIKMLADEPLWRGAPIVQPWSAGTSVDFFDPAGTTNLLHISRGSTLANASISNPGQFPGWLKYWIYGPTTSVVLGPGGRLISVPFTVPAGKLLVIDSHPTARTALQVDAPPVIGGASLPDADQVLWVAQRLAAGTAVDRTGELGEDTRWGSLPRGASVPVSVTLVGTGAVRAELVPRYRRAW